MFEVSVSPGYWVSDERCKLKHVHSNTTGVSDLCLELPSNYAGFGQLTRFEIESTLILNCTLSLY